VALWALLIGILVTASVAAGVLLLPSVLSSKPDFVMSLSLHPMYLQASGSNQTMITIQPVKNFTGIVTLTTFSSTGLTTRTQDSYTGGAKDQILLGKGGDVRLVVDDKKVGNFTVTVTASSGAISHSASFPVIVENLTMTSTPSSLTIMKGSTGTTEIDLSSVNGLSDNVTLGTSVQKQYGYLDPYSNSSVTPTSILVSPHGTGKIVLKISVGQAEIDSVIFVSVGARTAREPWNFYLYVQVNVV
jgi:hypothetical protein